MDIVHFFNRLSKQGCALIYDYSYDSLFENRLYIVCFLSSVEYFLGIETFQSILHNTNSCYQWIRM